MDNDLTPPLPPGLITEAAPPPRGVYDYAGEFAQGLADAPFRAMNGLVKTINDFQAHSSSIPEADTRPWQKPTGGVADFTSRAAMTVGTYLALRAAAKRIPGLPKFLSQPKGLWQSAGQAAAIGGLQTFLFEDPEEDRLSTILAGAPVPVLSSVANFLKADPENDGPFYERMKAAIEYSGIGLGIDTVAIPALRGLAKTELVESIGKFARVRKARLMASASPAPAHMNTVIEREVGVRPSDFDTIPPVGLRTNHTFEATLPGTGKKVSLATEVLSPEAEELAGDKAVQALVHGTPDECVSSLTFVHEAADTSKALESLILRATPEYEKWAATVTREEAHQQMDKAVKEMGIDGMLKNVKDYADMSAKSRTSIMALGAMAKDSFSALRQLAGKMDAGLATDLEKAQFVAHSDLLMKVLPAIEGAASETGRSLRFLSRDMNQSSYFLRALRSDPEIGNMLLSSRDVSGLINSDKLKGLAHKIITARDNVELFHVIHPPNGSPLMNVVIEQVQTAWLANPITWGSSILGDSISTLMDGVDSVMAYGGLRLGLLGKDAAERTAQMAALHAKAEGFWEGSKYFFKTLSDSFRRPPKELAELRGVSGAAARWRNAVNAASIDPTLQAEVMDGILPSSGAISRASLSQGAADATTPSLGDRITRFWAQADKSEFGKAVASLTPDKSLEETFWHLLDGYGSLVRGASFGMLSLIDNPFKNGHYFAKLAEDVTMLGYKGGGKYTPRMLDAFKKKVIRFAQTGKIINETSAMAKLIEEYHNKAMVHAKTMTYQQKLGTMGQSLSMAVNGPSFLSKVTKMFLLPFIKTPANLLKFTFSHGPTGALASEATRTGQALRGKLGEIERVKAYSAIMSGTLVYMGSMYLAASGKLTGAHPKSKRDDFLAVGIPEYSMMVGDTWYSLKRADPVATWLMLGADTFNVMNEYRDGSLEVGEAAGRMIVSVGNSIVNKSYLPGFNNFTKIFSNPMEFAQNYLKNLATGAIPGNNISKAINQTMDPAVRDTRAWLDSALNALPGGSLKAPKKMDALGRELTAPYPWASSLLLGLRSSSDKVPAFYYELAAHQVFPQDAPPTYLGMELSWEEFRKLKQIMQRNVNLNGRMTKLVQSQGYRKMSRYEREKALKKELQLIKEEGLHLLTKTDPVFKARTKLAQKALAAARRVKETEPIQTAPESLYLQTMSRRTTARDTALKLEL